MSEYPARSTKALPLELFGEDVGLPRSIQRLVDLVDHTDPAWPRVAMVLQEFAAAGIELDTTTVPLAVQLGKQRHLDLDGKLPGGRTSPGSATLAATADSIVYYIRRGGFIKIGTTVDPRSRFTELRPDEILAYEPGSYAEEAARHKRFMHLRHSGEYFRDDPELRDHIEHLRRLHGDPDPSWPTIATRGQRKPIRGGQYKTLPSPTSNETITVRDAEAELGIKQINIYQWARRGHLPLAGYDERRRRTYYREHLILLRDGFLTG